MKTPHECEECGQAVRLILGPYPAFFGHIASEEGWSEFMYDGLCELCANYLAEFSVMNNRKDMVP